MKINENKLGQIIAVSIKSVLNWGGSDNIAALFDLDAIPEEELRAQYVDLAPIVSMSGYGGRFMGMRGKIIGTKATSTLSTQETREQIQRKFYLKDWQLSIQEDMNDIRLNIICPVIFKNVKLIRKAMTFCGWKVVDKRYTWHDFMLWRVVSFAPMF